MSFYDNYISNKRISTHKHSTSLNLQHPPLESIFPSSINSFPSYSELVNFPPSTNIFAIIRQIHLTYKNYIEEHQNFINFPSLKQTIHNLRVLLKYQRVLFLKVFNKLIDYFLSTLTFPHLSSLSESFQYNDTIIMPSLNLVNEIFLSYHNETIYIEWLPLLLKHLILIVLNGENDVAFIANKCLNSCIHKCCDVSELSEIILDLIEDGDYNVGMSSIELLERYLKEDATNRKEVDVNDVVERIGRLLDSGKEELEEIGKRLMDVAKFEIGEEEFAKSGLNKKDVIGQMEWETDDNGGYNRYINRNNGEWDYAKEGEENEDYIMTNTYC